MMTNQDELAARAERGELKVKPGTVRRGAAARSAARDSLMEATGADTVAEALQLAVGRPRVGTEGGQSPVVRARVPQDLKDDVTTLAERENRRESEIVRDAVAAYVKMKRVS